jgi:hypothetical protein
VVVAVALVVVTGVVVVVAKVGTRVGSGVEVAAAEVDKVEELYLKDKPACCW